MRLSLKKWRRKWKLALIESINPLWQDLYEVIYKQGNLMCIDPQSKSGRYLRWLKMDRYDLSTLFIREIELSAAMFRCD